MEEIKFTNTFQFKNFLIRRSLRIWPLYFLIVFLGFSLEYFRSYYFLESEKLPSLWNFILFILNYDIIKNGYNFLLGSILDGKSTSRMHNPQHVVHLFPFFPPSLPGRGGLRSPLPRAQPKKGHSAQFRFRTCAVGSARRPGSHVTLARLG